MSASAQRSMTSGTSWAGLGFALLSAASFGMSGSFGKALIAGGWSPAAAILVRVSGAALILAIPTIYQLRGRWQLAWQARWQILMYGGTGVIATQLGYFNAIKHMSVGVALLIEYSATILVVLWLWLIGHKRPRLLTIISGAVAVGGLILALDLTGSSISLTGIAWALVAAVGLATYFVISGRSDSVIPPVPMVGLGMATGAVVMIILGLLHLQPMHFTDATTLIAGLRTSWVVPALGMILVATVFAYVTGIIAARQLGATVASFVGLTEVLFAVLFAWLALSEAPTWIQAIGGVLLLAGVAGVRYDDLRYARAQTVIRMSS
ncbi:MAG: EamA family transporter [Antricoccus sp.]